MSEELLNKKEPRVDDLGVSQPIQVSKGDKIKRLLSKAWHREKATSATVQPFVKTSEKSKSQSIQPHKGLFQEIKIMPHRSSQPNQRDYIFFPLSLSHLIWNQTGRRDYLK